MLKARQKFGKYIIERRIGQGGFAVVYQARDTIEGIRVALKIPFQKLVNNETMMLFHREARLAAKLDHPNILPLKYADYIDGKFAIVTALGEMTLQQRLTRRLATQKALNYAEQMLSAVAFAHENRVLHCDIKPDNFLLFSGDCIRLTDFGIAIVAQRTVRGSGSGTMGYIAPEQAMGRPSFRSDVFSLGLVLYEMFSGRLPEWPFEPPLPGMDRLRARLHPQLVHVILKSIQVRAADRYANAAKMLSAFQRAPKNGRAKKPPSKSKNGADDWRALRQRAFLRSFGSQLETRHRCCQCQGPVAEAMQACPWCGKARQRHLHESRYSHSCPRCLRGLKSDWAYCPWCYGAGFEVSTNRELSDKRYTAKCDNPSCQRQLLMPFMKYCPWCHRRVRRKWKIEGSSDRCQACGWGVLPHFWSYCPWCTKPLKNR